ncbi:MAG: hypothetical protein KKF48_03805, partial [Nanoarchaeota archaeon]|nr:hypothetical protein [Nanoarchaeota archaeon]
MKIPKEVGALILIGIMLFIGFLFPLTLVLSQQEISNETISFNLFLFSIILGLGLFGTFCIYFTRYWWKGDNKYGDSFGFFNIGEKPSLSFFKRFTAPQLALLSLILFGGLFLVVNILQLGNFSSTIFLPMQFSPSQSLMFSTFLIGTAEESMNIFVMGLLVLGLIFLAVRYKISYNEFLAYYFLAIPIIVGILARLWHKSAYVSSDLSLWVVFLFWTLKAFLILITGFVFIGLAMHWDNNFF